MKPYPWQAGLFSRITGSALPHALLLKGRAGIGKGDFAMALAQSVLCETKVEGGACGNCASCSWFAQGAHPDFRLIEPEALAADGDAVKGSKQITVDEIRKLADFVNLTTHQNGYRIILINPAEAMNQHAANALLKTLEEPPARTLFLLVSHKPQKLLPTILSRCRSIAMPAPAATEAVRWLEAQRVENADALLAESGFAPLAAAAAASQAETADRLLSQIGKPAALDPVELGEALQKIELGRIVLWLQKWCYDLASVKYSGKVRFFPGHGETLRSLASRIEGASLMRYQRSLASQQAISGHPLNPRLFIEALLWSYLELLKTDAPQQKR